MQNIAKSHGPTISLQAFILKNMMTVIKTKPGCDPNRNILQSGFFLRVMSAQGINSNPTPEGVHQDGCELTMTTLFKSSNVDFEAGAATSTLVTLDQPIGSTFDQVEEENIIDKVQHRYSSQY